MDKATLRHVECLADELREILKKCLWQEPAKITNEMARAGAIRTELEKMGLPVTWSAEINPDNPTEIKVSVTVWKPKKNFTPEQQKIYDDWFAQVNGIQK